MSIDIATRHLGLTEYRECWQIMRAVHADVVSGKCISTILTVSHPETLTLGRHAHRKHVIAVPAGVPLIVVERGGEVTAHTPGQLVIYPILHLGKLQIMPKRLVNLLEDTIIKTLRCFNIAGGRDAIHPGVWVGSNKIAAIGLRIEQRVSYHGLALNVANDLQLFAAIVPCGLQDRGVASMESVLDGPVCLESVRSIFMQTYAANLPCRLI